MNYYYSLYFMHTYLYIYIFFFVVDGHEINSINRGLCLLVGLQKTDGKIDIDAM